MIKHFVKNQEIGLHEIYQIWTDNYTHMYNFGVFVNNYKKLFNLTVV